MNGWDIYYRGLEEVQKSPQSIEDQKLHIQKIYSFDNEKNFFQRKNDVWQDGEEAHKDGRTLSYRDGMETWEVSQSKERQKLHQSTKISDRG